MRNLLLNICFSAVAVLVAGAANANEELIKMSQNPKDWVMPTGNYANQAEGARQQDAVILADACVGAARRIMTELLAQRAGVPRGRA